MHCNLSLCRMQSPHAASRNLVTGMTTAEPSRPSHKLKHSLVTSPFEQVAVLNPPHRLEGESVALISPATQSSQGQCTRRMSGKAFLAE